MVELRVGHVNRQYNPPNLVDNTIPAITLDQDMGLNTEDYVPVKHNGVLVVLEDSIAISETATHDGLPLLFVEGWVEETPVAHGDYVYKVIPPP